MATTTNMEYAADVQKYVPNADTAVIAKIVKHLGIALKSRDGASVSATSKDELARVRDSWLKKKLGLTHSDAELDAAIAEVMATMKDDRNKSRVAVYYMLAEKFDKLSAL